jgi:SAM-dependent methyltransferase
MPTAAGSPTGSSLGSLSGYVAVAAPADLERLLAATGGWEIAGPDGCCLVGHGNSARLSEAFPDRDAMRCLDRFDLILPQGREGREAVLAAFFEHLHLHYEALIEPERNLENIETLLAIVLRRTRSSPNPVLDFGCGPGLSARLGRHRGCRLLGFDPTVGMRTLAERHGLTTIDAAGLRSLPQASLRGAFASYVLHLQPCPEQLADVWRCIEPGGTFAANVHKGTGLEPFVAYASELGMSPTQVGTQSYDPRHGIYVTCSKD